MFLGPAKAELHITEVMKRLHLDCNLPQPTMSFNFKLSYHHILGGWLVAELRQIIFHTFWEGNGGGAVGEESRNTQDHHVEYGYLSLARYIIGTVYDVSDEREQTRILREGIYVMDFANAQRHRKSPKNANLL